jgi:pimeloyl-ACP methyl ester carboxylesterase
MVDHFSWRKRVPLSFDFCRDLAAKPEFPDIGGLPCTIVHGTEDVVVPIDLSKRFAAMHPQVVLHPVADSHELAQSVPWIADRVAEFLNSLE